MTPPTRPPGPDQPARRHRQGPWRSVISAAVTVAVLAVVFAGVFPGFADYSQAWSSIRQMPGPYRAALVVATVVNLAVYVWPFQAALPGLGYGPGFVTRQTGSPEGRAPGGAARQPARAALRCADVPLVAGDGRQAQGAGRRRRCRRRAPTARSGVRSAGEAGPPGDRGSSPVTDSDSIAA